MASNLFYIVVLLIGVVFAAVTCMIGIFMRRKRIAKYIPAGIAGIAALAFLIKTLFFSQGFEDLGYMILTMISAAVFGVSIITAIIMELVNRRNR